MLHDLLKFSQIRPKKIIFTSRKGQMKWLNHFISRKLLQKRPNRNPGKGNMDRRWRGKNEMRNESDYGIKIYAQHHRSSVIQTHDDEILSLSSFENSIRLLQYKHVPSY